MNRGWGGRGVWAATPGPPLRKLRCVPPRGGEIPQATESEERAAARKTRFPGKIRYLSAGGSRLRPCLQGPSALPEWELGSGATGPCPHVPHESWSR